MNTENKARKVLSEWRMYRGIHYSQKTDFGPAVDIEIEKSACQQLAEDVMHELLKPEVSESELSFRTRSLEDHLRIYKDRITFELLKNGN